MSQRVKRKAGRPAGRPQHLPDILGQQFGDLEVLAYIGLRAGKRIWRCRCLATERTGSECGLLCVVETGKLNRNVGRRCRLCNELTLRQVRQRASSWMYR